MLEMKIHGSEYFNEATNEFITAEDCILKLEHSLASLSKWESKWHKPFLSEDSKTSIEALDYIRCMTLNEDVDPGVYDRLSSNDIATINSYIEDKQTATWFRQIDQQPSRDIITAEIVYHWMIALQIPMECEKWHLNKLLTLIKVCNLKNGSGKKMSSQERLTQQHHLNASRLAQLRNGG